MEPVCKGLSLMYLEVGDSIIEDCIPWMDQYSLDQPLGPERETKTVFQVVLDVHRNINLPGAKEKPEGRLELGAHGNEYDFATIQ